jgi:hypothetical protein
MQAGLAFGKELTSGWRFCVVVISIYFIALLPTLSANNFDLSVFIVAGDKFVDAKQTASPILIRNNSSGYDGQFYYRMAVSPFTFVRSASGVTFDDPPAWRTQRIGYPLVTWAASFGQAKWVPFALVFVNLLGLGAIAWFSTQLTAKLRLSEWVPVLIVIWPGFIYTLTRDTTEILATAFLLAALDAYFGRKLFSYWVLAVAASLTRETSILMFGGIFVFEAFRFVRDSERSLKRLGPIVIMGSIALPFLAWRYTQLYLWSEPPTTRDLGVPFAGIFEVLKSYIMGILFESLNTDTLTTTLRIVSVASLLFLIVFAATVASGLRKEAVGRTMPLVFGWVFISALVASLRADGPYIGPHAYLRALTEWYVIGCLLLPAKISRNAASYLRGSALLIWSSAWAVSFIQIAS